MVEAETVVMGVMTGNGEMEGEVKSGVAKLVTDAFFSFMMCPTLCHLW